MWKFNPAASETSTDQWAWMGVAGSKTLSGDYGSAPGVYPTQAGAPAASGLTPGGRESASSWVDKNGNLWLFGGQGEGAGANCAGGSFGDLNDMWEFNPTASESSTNQWAWMAGSCTPGSNGGQPGVYPKQAGAPAARGLTPGGRYAASSWTDSNGNFWLFGGEGYDANGNLGELNDMWEFSPSKNEWAWMGGSSTVPLYSGQPGVYGMSGVFGAGYIPGGRNGALSWTDGSGDFWLFGGEGYDALGNYGYLNDLWEFNPANNQWAWEGGSSAINDIGASVGAWPGVYGTLETPAAENIPGGRYEAANWTDSSGHFWLFGGDGYGFSSVGFLNDLWEFNSPTSQWVWMSGSTTPFQSGTYGAQTPPATGTPGSRIQAASWTDSSGNLWLFGGSGRDGNDNQGELNDLWEYPPPAVSFGGTAAATPLFSVASGTYSTTQTVSITDATANATVYYTLNGATPTTGISGTNYLYNSSTPIVVSSTEALEAIATAPGDSTSAVAYAVYTIVPQAETPTFLPVAGNYSSAQTVTISDTTPGAHIFYTTNGTTPSFSGTGLSPYPNPGTSEGSSGLQITVSSTETVEAIATAYGYLPSAVGTALYTIGLPAAATPTFSLAAGPYTSVETVTISDTTANATIYYATDGSTLSTSSPLHCSSPCGPIPVSSTETLEAMATASGYTPSAVATALYTITLPAAATPTFLPVAGTYTSVQMVSISDTTPNAILYYTTDGSPATTSSLLNCSSPCGPITVSSSETINAIATASGFSTSTGASALYTIVAEVMDPETITVTDTVKAYTSIAITPSPTSFNASTSAAGAAGQAYGPVTFTATGGVGTLTLTETGALPPGLIFTIVNGFEGISVPTSSGVLAGQLSSNSAGTYTFSVTATDADNDQTTQQGYTLTIETQAATPTFSLAAGIYTTAQTVTISDTTPNATIYYTTNDTPPTKSSPLNCSIPCAPITVSSTETVEAIATASGYAPSAVATAAYTLNNPAPVISGISPEVASAGGAAFTLTVTGSGFIPNSTIYWGATALAPGTINVGETQLTAQVTTADIANAGIINITVQTPAPGGGTSNAFQFEVDSASGTTTGPIFTSTTETVAAGTPATYAVTLPSGATSVTATCLNAPAGTTCTWIAATNSVQITVPSTTPAGTYKITVVLTLTESGAATGFILLPILLLPLVFLRRKLAARGVCVTACLGLVLLAGAVGVFIGCGGSAATHTVTSSGVVSLIVQ
jgi:N-acetylneuraminic acid mutarotase